MWTLDARLLDDSQRAREPGPGSIQARRPIPKLSAIRAIRFDGKSPYNRLVLKIERLLRGNVALSASHTL